MRILVVHVKREYCITKQFPEICMKQAENDTHCMFYLTLVWVCQLFVAIIYILKENLSNKICFMVIS